MRSIKLGIVATFLIGMSSSALAQFSYGTSYGGYTSGGVTYGGVTIDTSGGITVGGVSVGGIKVGGMTYGTLTVGGVQLGSDSQSSSSKSSYDWRRNSDSTSSSSTNDSPSSVSRSAAQPSSQQTQKNIVQAPPAKTVSERDLKIAAKRANLQNLKQGDMFASLDVMFIDADCAGMTFEACSEYASRNGAFSASTQVTLIGEKDKRAELELFARAVNEHDDGGAGGKITLDELLAKTEALTYELQKPFASPKVMDNLAKKCGIEDLKIRAQFVFTATNFYDVYEVFDYSTVSIGLLRKISLTAPVEFKREKHNSKAISYRLLSDESGLKTLQKNLKILEYCSGF